MRELIARKIPRKSSETVERNKRQRAVRERGGGGKAERERGDQ